MIANRLAKRRLEIKETLIESRRILSIQGYHLGARFTATNDLDVSPSHPCDNRLGHRGSRLAREAELRAGL